MLFGSGWRVLLLTARKLRMFVVFEVFVSNTFSINVFVFETVLSNMLFEFRFFVAGRTAMLAGAQRFGSVGQQREATL